MTLVDSEFVVDTAVDMVDSLKSVLLCAQELCEADIAKLRDCLHKKTIKELRILAKSISVRLTGSSHKGDIADRLIAMGKIGAVRDVSQDDDTNSDNTEISCMTSEVIQVLRRLLPFESVKNWSKELNVLSDFTFMNLLIYLVYGKDKSFDMHALKSFKSLKAYKFFYDGFVKNVWVHEFPPSEDPLHLRVLYFHAYVHHSLTYESPLEVFVCLNGDNGDVYSAKCTCVSG